MTNRSPATEATAQHFRQIRRNRAQLLKETRRAALTEPSAREYLETLRAEGCPVPNPDRRRDCARHATRALALYEALLSTTDLDSTHGREVLTAAASSADEYALLQLTATN